MNQSVKEYENHQVKIEVIEVTDGYITTRWHKLWSEEFDREVFVFETFGGAMDKAFDLLIEFIENEGELKQYV